MQIKKQLLGACVASSVVSLCGIAWGDPLSGEVLKFYQAPLNNAGPIYPQQASSQPQDVSASPFFAGHDEFSTARLSTIAPALYFGITAADDFGDNFLTPIEHVTFWGSYMNRYDPTNAANGGFVQRFLINFYTENPGSTTAGIASSPMTLYSSQIVTAGALSPQSGTFTESAVPGTSGASGLQDTGVYKYNAELKMPVAEPVKDTSAGPAPGPVGTVDWISIIALTGGANDGNPNIQWGWHDRDYGIFDPLAIGTNPTGTGETNLNPLLNNPTGQPVYHFQDDAVEDPAFTYDPGSGISTAGSYTSLNYQPGGTDLPGGVVPYSEDLAFALYTSSPVPEPGSLSLIGLGALGLLRRRNRKLRT